MFIEIGGPKNTLLLDIIRQHVNQFWSNRIQTQGESFLRCAHARVCGRECFNGID